MITIREIPRLRAALAGERLAGRSIGLVPTMGAFHDGHLSLIRRARAQCDTVVVSLFVNPAQFDDAGDLEAYPRDERRDAELADDLGVAYLFAPAREEIYPPSFVTTIHVGGITDRLEGTHRGRGHFDGVATVVAKLLAIVAPDRAYFGRKDAQQLAVVRRLVRDLDLPVAIEACPIVRAADGLALSSRNARLSAGERTRATALHRALEAIGRAVAAGERDPAAALAVGHAELRAAGIAAEYLAIVDPETFEPAHRVAGAQLAVVAARVGPVRLIDNLPLPDRAGAIAPPAHPEVATPIGAPTS